MCDGLWFSDQMDEFCQGALVFADSKTKQMPLSGPRNVLDKLLQAYFSLCGKLKAY